MNDFLLNTSSSEETTYEILSTMAASESFSPIPLAGVKSTPTIKASPTKRKQRPKKHPAVEQIVDEAIYEKGPRRKGLSLVGIKKFIHEKYDLNVKRLAKSIREYIKESVQNGRFIQTTGRGANGSFRLASDVRMTFNRQRNSQVRNAESKANITSKINRKRKADLIEPSLVSTPKKKKHTSVRMSARSRVK